VDNITHTLIGALIGEGAARTAPPAANEPTAAVRRTLFLTVMIVGSNLPDSDLVYSLGDESKLPYLLEHRGHTHTVIGALVGSAVMLAVCALFLRLRNRRLSPRDWIWLSALALGAPLLHIAMDALNTYGVHPWWPVDNRWFYGDSVFIVEPLFWASAAPLALLFRSLVARGLVVLCLLLAVYLALVTGIVAGASIVAFCVLTLTMLLLGWYAKPKSAVFTALGACAVIGVVFVVAHGQAIARLDSDGASRLTGWKTLDRVLTPLPMNPLCWEAILVQEQGDRYALRRAMVSLAPNIRCPARSMDRPITAPLAQVDAADTPYLRWHGQFTGSREQLRDLAASSCEVVALLRFARAPWFRESEPRIAGDLRYDREPEPGFAEIVLTHAPRCPAYVPPWVPPRKDLLR
jgi:inner membrane protein